MTSLGQIGLVCSQLSQAPLFTAIQGTTNIDIAWLVWLDICVRTIRPFVPSRKVRLHQANKSKGWLSSELKRLCSRKKRLFNAARRSRSNDAWQKYKQIRNRCTNAVNQAKADYFEQKEDDLVAEIDGSYRWWQKAKWLAKITSPKDTVPDLTCTSSGRQASSSNDKAKLLAEFFAQQCTDHGKSADVEQGAPYPLLESHPVFTFPPIPEELVLRKLLRLKVNKSTGDSLLCNQVPKRCAPFLASSKTYLFNLSLSTCSFPCAWKLAKVIPLYENRGSQSDPSNYRPISLLPAIGKVMDDIQSARLLSFLTTNKLISPHQLGFVPRSSIVHQLVYMVHKWTQIRDNGGNFSATFMDFMKAFDRVWHSGLLYKLAECGISLSSLAWIRDYLSNRHITVQVHGSKSLPKPISAGVPQGSDLGPVLFVVFINDLPSHTKPVATELYADDALLHQLHPRCEELSLMPLQNVVEAAENWALSWHGRK